MAAHLLAASSGEGLVRRELAAVSLDMSGVSGVGNEVGQDFSSTAGLVEKIIGVLGLNEDGRRSRKRVGARKCGRRSRTTVVIVLSACLDSCDIALGELEGHGMSM